MLIETQEHAAPPMGDEATQPVARRLISDDGINWRPYDWQDSDVRRARFERVEIVNDA